MRRPSLLFLIIALVFSLSNTACSGSRKARDYSYLLDEDATYSGSVKKVPLKAVKVVSTAQSYIGTPYKFGGASKKGMDCSGLVCTSFKTIDKELPRTSRDMSKKGKQVSKSQLAPGDLVFFSAGSGGKINHVGLVSSVRGKEVTFVHATTSRGVREDKLSDPYWKKRFRKGTRVL